MEFDYNRAGILLMIVEKVAAVAPSFTAISGEAMRELKEMNQAFVESKAIETTALVQPTVYKPTPLDEAIGIEAPETGANEPTGESNG